MAGFSERALFYATNVAQQLEFGKEIGAWVLATRLCDHQLEVRTVAMVSNFLICVANPPPGAPRMDPAWVTEIPTSASTRAFRSSSSGRK
jgi:hypothetical protein